MSLDPVEFARLTEHCRILGELEACAHDRDAWTVASRWAHVSKRLLSVHVGRLDPFEEANCFYAFASALRESSTFRAAKSTEGGVCPAPAGLQFIVWDEPAPAPGEKPSLIANAPDPVDPEPRPAEPPSEPTLVDEPPERREAWRRYLYSLKGGPVR